jgi:prolyl-tRNA synthetase
MRYSQLFSKTRKSAPQDADSANARLLVQGGFVDQLAAGIYTFLPLGLRVLEKIKAIVREEMNALGAQEIFMPALHPAEPWKTTGRWEDPGKEVMFQFEGRGDKEFGLGWTHEEIVTPLLQKFIQSYKDLPAAVYQIQDKFRNEPRAKSGLLRGREFSMKDLYSFHLTEKELEAYYDRVAKAYDRVFKRCGLQAILTEASGGAFSKYSHEFQVPTESGEDIIFACDKCSYAQNREISEYKDGARCPKCKGTMREEKAIEVGNIFKLKTRFTEAFGFTVAGEDGKKQPVLMGCYGIGPSRVMGTVVEVHHDEKGIRWPKTIAPFTVELVSLGTKNKEAAERVVSAASAFYDELSRAGVEVLWDDREGASAGEKFADADLIGIPLRLVISEKTLAENSVEWKERHEAKARLVSLEDAKSQVVDFIQEPYETTTH